MSITGGGEEQLKLLNKSMIKKKLESTISIYLLLRKNDTTQRAPEGYLSDRLEIGVYIKTSLQIKGDIVV